MIGRSWADESRTIFVCVDDYTDGILQGRVYGGLLERGREFRSHAGFLLETEKFLDKMEFPKAFSAIRTFAPAPETDAPLTHSLRQEGKLANFALRILFRQNASWQGAVTWLEQKSEQSFRSVLELILLLDNALTQKQVQ